MRGFSLFFLIFISGLSVYSQTKTEILESEFPKFKAYLEINNSVLDKSDWEILRKKALKFDLENNYGRASVYAQKASLLAESLQDQMLIARSLHLLGKIQLKAPQSIISAGRYFADSLTSFTKIEKTLETRKWVGYVINDLALLYINPDSVHSEKEKNKGGELLSQIYQMSEKYSNPDYLDLDILTAINISHFYLIKGHLLTQILWLEKAEKLNNRNEDNENFFSNSIEINLRLQRSYRRIGEYEKAFNCLVNLNKLLTKYPNDYIKLEYLRQLEDSYADLNKTKPMFAVLEEGINLSNKLNYRKNEFLTLKILRLLQEGKTLEAKENLQILEKLSNFKIENIDLAVIKAVIAGSENDVQQSNQYFELSEKILNENLDNDWINALFLLNHESRVADFLKQYEKLLSISKRYLDIATTNNNKDSLPFVYLEMAKAEYGLGNLQKAEENCQESIKLIENKRKASSAQVSIGVMEVLYKAYELQITLSSLQSKNTDAFMTSELLKSRWLQDKIENNRLKPGLIIDAGIGKIILDKSVEALKNIDNLNLMNELTQLENKNVFIENQNSFNEILSSKNELLSALENSSLTSDTAIISYSFAGDKLTAFIWQKGKDLKLIPVGISKSEVDQIAESISFKIKNFIYLKKDAKEIFDKLLGPLKISAPNLIIIPDKSIWKIPFQALSQDGKKYLIETNQISYSPSVSILLNQINHSLKPRQSAQVFANSTYDNLFLRYADLEASEVGRLLNVRPFLNSSTKQFLENSQQADILHFSLHSELNSDEPFNSYLAFKANSQNNGKITVEDLLNLHLKKDSLAFLASCNTNNVFNGEGLVSLAWGMMGAGASTVISSQWEANDKSTSVFAKYFYQNYKAGNSTSLSMQKAALEMIYDKNNEFNQPYFWAQFTLLGDFR
ncbi:MAG TPA: CHAT domain-containing protein [Pyrinomonadaceae bacterium]|nr:CHAT domain-containing protein [Pyrinomonadaceae bacterium]